MTTVEIEHVRRRTGQDQERTEVAGRLSKAGGQQNLQPGTFGLRAVSQIEFGQVQGSKQGTAIIGSARPNAIGSAVSVEAVLDQGGNLGSQSPVGTVTAPFTAYGY